jgi:hypothetical protein
MFHYFKIPYFTCNFFTKLTYNEYIGPYFLSHVVLGFSPSDLPEGALQNLLLCSERSISEGQRGIQCKQGSKLHDLEGTKGQIMIPGTDSAMKLNKYEPPGTI